VFRDGKLASIVDGPSDRVFDILPENGIRTDAGGPTQSVAELDLMFRRNVGPLLFETQPPRRNDRSIAVRGLCRVSCLPGRPAVD
jgi:hypothetical protein